MSRKEALEKIEEFFRKDNFSVNEMKKIKKMAMSNRIRLGKHRKEFCKKCLSKLDGRTRVGKLYKTIECSKCGFRNRIKLS